LGTASIAAFSFCCRNEPPNTGGVPAELLGKRIRRLHASSPACT
jgi:hypothetical protein